MLSYLPVVGRLITGGRPDFVDIPSVKIHNVETAPEKAPRTVKHLLRANHVNHSILYHHLQFHNHLPHIVCSAYLLGGDERHLHRVYDAESAQLDEWVASPQEITRNDWRDFLGDRRYQRAYVDFFEDVLVWKHSYDWKKLMNDFLFEGELPLVNALFGGRRSPCQLFFYFLQPTY